MKTFVSITLASGVTREWEWTSIPKSGRRHWKSWAMRQLPYGTDFMGCVFGTEKR